MAKDSTGREINIGDTVEYCKDQTRTMGERGVTKVVEISGHTVIVVPTHKQQIPVHIDELLTVV